MQRAPFQVLIFPFAITGDDIRYALFRRNDATGGYWQGIAGGGEHEESPLQAARRETSEEAGIGEEGIFYQLDSVAMIPVVNICGFRWGPDVLVIPEYSFGVAVEKEDVILSNEHTECLWLDAFRAMELLKWDSNRTALWELNHRIRHGMLRLE